MWVDALHMSKRVTHTFISQTKDSWSKLRLVGKFSSFAVGHVLLNKDIVTVSKVERIMMTQYLAMWHFHAHEERHRLEKYRR